MNKTLKHIRHIAKDDKKIRKTWRSVSWKVSMLQRMRGCEGKVRGKDKKIGYGDDIAYKPLRKHKSVQGKRSVIEMFPQQIIFLNK